MDRGPTATRATSMGTAFREGGLLHGCTLERESVLSSRLCLTDPYLVTQERWVAASFRLHRWRDLEPTHCLGFDVLQGFLVV